MGNVAVEPRLQLIDNLLGKILSFAPVEFARIERLALAAMLGAVARFGSLSFLIDDARACNEAPALRTLRNCFQEAFHDASDIGSSSVRGSGQRRFRAHDAVIAAMQLPAAVAGS